MEKDLKIRTKLFSHDIITLLESMEYSPIKRVIINQLLRSATSVGANYRAATRARSDREFIAKLRIVHKEVDECCFWLEIISERKWADVDKELKEANELTAIIVSSLKTMYAKIEKNKK